MTWIDFLIPLLMLVFSGFFSGTEIAFVSANKLKIELKSLQGNRPARILSKFIKNTPRVITTLLIGNAVALVVWGIYFGKLLGTVMRPTLEGWLGPIHDHDYWILIPETIISTLIILIIGEYMPKAAFRLDPDRMISISGPFLNFFYVLFGPFVSIINSVSTFLLRTILRIPFEKEKLVFSKTDLDHFIHEHLAENEGTPTHEIDTEMFSNALEFNKIKARDSMVPRTEIVSLPLDTPVDEFRKLFIETELSKILVYGETLDDVKGYVHSSALFSKPDSIHSVLRPVLIVPDSMPAHILLKEFTRNRKSVAIVVDEFGGTEGLITIEDLVEEVFGEIHDEHDEPVEEELLKKRLNENTWLFSARLTVDEVNKEFELDLPEGDYTTLAGIVMYFAETIPAVNESIQAGNYRITVTDGAENKLNTVKVERVPAEE